MRALGGIAASVLACACAADDAEVLDVAASGGVEEFATYVQPVLEAGCASLDCHGVAGRPLRLYGRDGLRLDADLRGMDATEQEVAANIRAIDGLTPAQGQIEDHLILRKPLAIAAGGMHHVGGELWLDQSDPAYRCLHAWLRAGVSDEAGQDVCAEAVP